MTPTFESHDMTIFHCKSIFFAFSKETRLYTTVEWKWSPFTWKCWNDCERCSMCARLVVGAKRTQRVLISHRRCNGGLFICRMYWMRLRWMQWWCNRCTVFWRRLNKSRILSSTNTTQHWQNDNVVHTVRMGVQNNSTLCLFGHLRPKQNTFAFDTKTIV